MKIKTKLGGRSAADELDHLTGRSAERMEHLREVAAALREAYPLRGDGKTLFAFKRIFMVIGL